MSTPNRVCGTCASVPNHPIYGRTPHRCEVLKCNCDGPHTGLALHLTRGGQPKTPARKLGVRSDAVPESVARWVIRHSETVRVEGTVVCEDCSQTYRDHDEILPTFHLLCDGRLGKT